MDSVSLMGTSVDLILSSFFSLCELLWAQKAGDHPFGAFKSFSQWPVAQGGAAVRWCGGRIAWWLALLLPHPSPS